MPASAAYCQRLLHLEETHSPEIGNAINMALELPAPACSSHTFVLQLARWSSGFGTNLSFHSDLVNRTLPGSACARPSCSVNVIIGPLEPENDPTWPTQ
jgi:hypothetical protein